MKNEDRVLSIAGVHDRLLYAQNLARGKRVLDVGGAGMPPSDKPNVHSIPSLGMTKTPPDQSVFALTYRQIRELSSEYRVVDQQQDEKQLIIDYPLDLNDKTAVDALGCAIDEYRPEVILCMETLEHVNYHYEVMNHFARAVDRDGAEVFISLPNNANWLLNALGWNHDHCVGFFQDVAKRFVARSNLGKHQIVYIPCFQKYLWYWPLAYAVSFGQPFSLGFHVRPLLDKL